MPDGKKRSRFSQVFTERCEVNLDAFVSAPDAEVIFFGGIEGAKLVEEKVSFNQFDKKVLELIDLETGCVSRMLVLSEDLTLN